MIPFYSHHDQLKKILTQIVTQPAWHGKWLNTLSYLENCGARQIAAYEHPTQVKEDILKHAAEEFRHAYYLKCQIPKVCAISLNHYSKKYLLGGTASLHYLKNLNVQTSRYLLKTLGLCHTTMKEIAYVLVTYAIEVRATELYNLYHNILCQIDTKVRVKSIILEEKEHLDEMTGLIHQWSNGFNYAKQICLFETQLCQKWLNAIEQEIQHNPKFSLA